MATIKSYTDIEQSRKLVEILPINSADMDYIPVVNTDNIDGEYSVIVNEWGNDHIIDEGWIPCWSLTALLNTLPNIKIRGSKKIGYIISYNKNIATKRYFDIVDACYEMIIKLHELNLL